MSSQITPMRSATSEGPSADRGERQGIQVLRAVAALLVVIHHALEQSNGPAARFSPNWLTTSGAAGVDVFFVISGFIMLYTSFRSDRPVAPGRFLLRRVTRIYPFYWLCCFAMLAFSVAGFMRNNRLAPYDFVMALTLLPHTKMILGVAWTLVYEVYFYAIFAAFLVFASKRIAVAGTTIAIIGFYVAGLLLLQTTSSAATFLANPIPLEFCMGLWIAHWHLNGGRLPRFADGALFTALALIMIACAPLVVAHTGTNGLPGLARVVAWGVPAAALVTVFLAIERKGGVAWRFGVLLGDASYALYLTHSFVMIVFAALLKTAIGAALSQPQLIIAAIIAVFVAIIVGLAAHLLVEKPMQRWIRYAITQRAKPNAPAPC